MIDPTGFILTIIRDDPAVAALVAGRVRGGEPSKGDALGPGHFQRFVVLSRLGGLREKRLPVQEVRIAARCYGLTAQDAAALAGAVSDAIHAIGPRVSSGGVGIWVSFDDGDGGADRDPDTTQPLEHLIISVAASTEAIA
jgi:hypothetical protein